MYHNDIGPRERTATPLARGATKKTDVFLSLMPHASHPAASHLLMPWPMLTYRTYVRVPILVMQVFILWKRSLWRVVPNLKGCARQLESCVYHLIDPPLSDPAIMSSTSRLGDDGEM